MAVSRVAMMVDRRGLHWAEKTVSHWAETRVYYSVA